LQIPPQIKNIFAASSFCYLTRNSSRCYYQSSNKETAEKPNMNTKPAPYDAAAEEAKIAANHEALRAQGIPIPWVDYDPILEDMERRRKQKPCIQWTGD
jgi:hypothetical protein